MNLHFTVLVHLWDVTSVLLFASKDQRGHHHQSVGITFYVNLSRQVFIEGLTCHWWFMGTQLKKMNQLFISTRHLKNSVKPFFGKYHNVHTNGTKWFKFKVELAHIDYYGRGLGPYTFTILTFFWRLRLKSKFCEKELKFNLLPAP